jgi:hypothetical protein
MCFAGLQEIVLYKRALKVHCGSSSNSAGESKIMQKKPGSAAGCCRLCKAKKLLKMPCTKLYKLLIHTTGKHAISTAAGAPFMAYQLVKQALLLSKHHDPSTHHPQYLMA